MAARVTLPADAPVELLQWHALGTDMADVAAKEAQKSYANLGLLSESGQEHQAALARVQTQLLLAGIR